MKEIVPHKLGPQTSHSVYSFKNKLKYIFKNHVFKERNFSLRTREKVIL